MAFDYIEPGSLEEYPLPLRVVRVKIKDGVYENLITNLPLEEFGINDLYVFYYICWLVENTLRELKHAVGAVNFHSKAVKHVIHEIWVRLLLYNFSSQIISLAVIKQNNTKYTYQVNYTMAISNSHDFLRQKPWEPEIEIVGLIEKYTLPIRPVRNFARKHRFQRPMKFTYRH